MGKAGRTRRHIKKMQARRAAKAARRAAYAALRGTSKKIKKIRARSRTKWSSAKHQHLTANCGNIGCIRCYPQFKRNVLNGRVLSDKRESVIRSVTHL